MDTRWNLSERQLIIELAVGLARHIVDTCPPSDAEQVGPGYVFHMYSSAWVNGCDVLWRLGVAHAAYGPEPHRQGMTVQTVVYESLWPRYFRFFPETEIRDALSSDIPGTAPDLDEILSGYVGMKCQYGYAVLTETRDPIDAEELCVSEVDALILTGYMIRSGNSVIWTDKIAKAMRAAHLWDEDNRAYVDIWRQ